MNEQEFLTPLDIALRRRATRRFWIFVAIVVIVAAALYFLWLMKWNVPVAYADIEEHFKYGSIGSDYIGLGIPYWIWKVLPEMFPDKLPGEGYESLGFLYEPGKDLPIGISKRRFRPLLDSVGLNCAMCHTSTVRDTPEGEPRIVLGMPPNRFDLQGFIRLLTTSVLDERFTPERVMAEIQGLGADLNFIERLVYHYFVIPLTRDRFITLGSQMAFMERQPDYGRGRVDTFGFYKTTQFSFPVDGLRDDELYGIVDPPSIWNQKPREGMQLHWDGNNTSVHERNLSASFGTLVTPPRIDLRRLKRVEDWLWELPPPAYPYEINQQLASKGEGTYKKYCADCHDFGGSRVGKVTPIDEIGTDPGRLNTYTYELNANQNTLYAGYPWRFKHFRMTNGYANMPLDGIWLRAPYLHNGSVPTLRDLLEPPDGRPKTFYRGYDVYERKKVGFVSDVPEENDPKYFKYDTTIPGNRNGGHLYGIDLSPEEKDALVEYMKKL